MHVSGNYGVNSGLVLYLIKRKTCCEYSKERSQYESALLSILNMFMTVGYEFTHPEKHSLLCKGKFRASFFHLVTTLQVVGTQECRPNIYGSIEYPKQVLY